MGSRDEAGKPELIDTNHSKVLEKRKQIFFGGIWLLNAARLFIFPQTFLFNRDMEKSDFDSFFNFLQDSPIKPIRILL